MTIATTVKTQKRRLRRRFRVGGGCVGAFHPGGGEKPGRTGGGDPPGCCHSCPGAGPEPGCADPCCCQLDELGPPDEGACCQSGGGTAPRFLVVGSCWRDIGGLPRRSSDPRIATRPRAGRAGSCAGWKFGIIAPEPTGRDRHAGAIWQLHVCDPLPAVDRSPKRECGSHGLLGPGWKAVALHWHRELCHFLRPASCPQEVRGLTPCRLREQPAAALASNAGLIRTHRRTSDGRTRGF
jgi:hypothetical protein